MKMFNQRLIYRYDTLRTTDFFHVYSIWIESIYLTTVLSNDSILAEFQNYINNYRLAFQESESIH